MNPAWISALVAVVGLYTNLVWFLALLRMESRISGKVEDLKQWVSRNFVPRQNPPVSDVGAEGWPV